MTRNLHAAPPRNAIFILFLVLSLLFADTPKSFADEGRAIAKTISGGAVSSAITGGIITGKVIDTAGKPVPQIPVHVQEYVTLHNSAWIDRGGGTKTDREGSFKITNLKTDGTEYRVVADEMGDIPFTTGKEISFSDDKPTAHVVLTVERQKRNCSVSGVVVDYQGKPVQGADVCLEHSVDEWNVDQSVNISTDSVGRYAFGGLRPRDYTIRAQKAGFVTTSTQVNLMQGPQLKDAKMVLHRTRMLKGILKDLAGKALQGWTVEAHDRFEGYSNYHYFGHARTGRNGEFSMEVHSVLDKFFFMVRPPENSQPNRYDYYAFESGQINMDDKVKELTVPFGGTIKGRLLREGTKQPLSTATLSIKFAVDYEFSTVRGGLCKLYFGHDPECNLSLTDGRFRLAGLPITTCTIMISSDPQLRKAIENVDIKSKSPTELGDVFLSDAP